MRKLALCLLGATALGTASAANATVTLLTCSMSCTGPATTGDTTTIGYSEALLDNPTFTESLSFSNDLDGLYSITLSTSSAAVDFTSAVLSDGVTNYALHFVGASGPNEFWGLDTTFIPMGTDKLTIMGDNNDTGDLGGTVTINPAAVPEPATWALMLLGLGAVGWQLRRRKNALGLAQLA